MTEIHNSSTILDGLRSIIFAVDRCFNPSLNDENDCHIVHQQLQERNDNGGGHIVNSSTPTTEENDDEDSVISFHPKDLVVPYENDDELLLYDDVKAVKTEDQQACPVLCFDCNEKDKRCCNNTNNTSNPIPVSPSKQKQLSKPSQPLQLRSNNKMRNATNQTDGAIKPNPTKQPNPQNNNVNRLEDKKEIIEQSQKTNSRKLDRSLNYNNISNDVQDPPKCIKEKNHTTTNWKHVFWNNYFRNMNNSSSPKLVQQMGSTQTPPKFTLPFDTLMVPHEFKRSDISELTMKSSHGHHHYHAVTTLLDSTSRSNINNRVMAYYAVGQHCPNNSKNTKERTSNRKCYFSGKMIFNGMPFYAGSLRQGYKTLVVFCLPQAIGLPQIRQQQKQLSPITALTSSTSLNRSFSSSHPKSITHNNNKYLTKNINQQLNCSAISESSSSAACAISNATVTDSNAGGGYHSNSKHHTYPNSSLRHNHSYHQQHFSQSTLSGTLTSSNGCYSISHDYSSTYDHTTTTSSTASDDDYNCGTDGKARHDENSITHNDTYYDALLEKLPNPSCKLLHNLKQSYPESYKTLPSSIQNNVESWSIYNKFCYFSGLPICPDDLHYKYTIKSKCTKSGNILLSHEIMEVVLGKDSADLVRLPNTAVFDYLKLNYKNQFIRLGEELVFERYAWQVVLPEV